VKLWLFDDAVADAWAPFALSRPVGELRFGALLLRERTERWTGLAAEGHLTRPWLSAYEEPGAPPAVEPGDLPADEDRLLLASRFVPAQGEKPADPAALRETEEAAVLLAGGRPAGCWLPAGTGTPDRAWLAEPGELPGGREVEVGGSLLEAPWEIVALGTEALARDIRLLAPGAAPAAGPSDLPDGVHLLGSGGLHLAPGVRIEPGAVLDARGGPIWLGRGVEVLAGCRLEGPLRAGAGSRLLGGPIGPLSAGPVSYLRGEVADVHVLGWSNKAHDGHLGHAVLGRWVNLGAGTANSDLKNNYGSVRVGPPGRERDTGLLKMGSLLGDHARTAIGIQLDTGTVVGAGANLFGPGRPPRWVPPFAWGFGEGAGRYRRDAFLATAETVMGRRDVTATAGVRRWLGAVWDAAAEADAG